MIANEATIRQFPNEMNDNNYSKRKSFNNEKKQYKWQMIK